MFQPAALARVKDRIPLLTPVVRFLPHQSFLVLAPNSHNNNSIPVAMV